MPQGRLLATLKTLGYDLRSTAKLSGNMRSRFRLSLDFVLSRIIGVVPRQSRNRVREVVLRENIKIRYRLNKGDINTLREIWLDEAYCGPLGKPTGVLLDLGANIGMTSVWLTKKFAFTQVIAVEPDPGNAALLRQNLDLNKINGQVLEAAIGPQDGIARFNYSNISNQGQLSENGSPVPMLSVDTIIKKFEVIKFGLVKIDIEGGEQALFEGPTAWLGRTDAIVIEFHPSEVDYPQLAALVSSHGFKYIPAHSFVPDNLDIFTKIS
jgi:FkbM family methyltransferase